MAAGNAQHIAKGSDNGVWIGGTGQCLINVADRRDADRTPRAGHEVYVVRQEVLKAEPEYAHGVRPADFHDIIVAVLVGDIAYLSCDVHYQGLISEFINVFHGPPSMPLMSSGLLTRGSFLSRNRRGSGCSRRALRP